MEGMRIWSSRLRAILFLPVVVLIMVPLAILLAVAFYCRALVMLFVHLGAYPFSKKPPPGPEESLQKPHFLETRVQIKEINGD